MNQNDIYYTLITGASSGIGGALAEEFARRHRNLLLISLPDTGLEKFCEKLTSKYNVLCRFFEIDMLDSKAPDKIRGFVQDKNLRINILINNVGAGHAGNMGDYSTEEIDEMILLNIRSTTHLTNLFIEELKSHPESFILNMGSFGAFVPTPHKSIYMASKAYIYYFSCGLSAELKNSSVKVCIAMPGSVRSNKKMIDRIKSDGAMSNFMALTPGEVAKYVVPRLFSGEKVIIPGMVTKAVYFLGLALPYALILYFMKNMFSGKKY